MDYRTLGRSGCAVSTLALGTMTFGKETDEAGSHAQLDAFVEAGGNLIDTADVYTAGASEEIIGRWLADRPAGGPRPRRARHQGPLPDGRRTPTTSASPAGTCSARSTPRCAGSASSTSTSTRCTPGTRSPRSRRPCGFLDDAVRAGKIALRRPVELHRLAGAEGRRTSPSARGWAAPVTLQPQYNLLVREIEWEIVPACLDAGLGLLPWSPLGGGWLTGKYKRDERADRRHPARREPRRAAWRPTTGAQRAAAHLGRRRRGRARSPRAAASSMAQVALAWLADRPGGHLGDPRRPHHRAARRQPRRRRPAPRPRRRPRGSTRPATPAPADYPYGGPGVHQRGRTVDPAEWLADPLPDRSLGTIWSSRHGAGGCSSVGRARPSQGRCREFESRHPLHSSLSRRVVA